MRRLVREHNIYRWAGLLLGDLSRIPHDATAGEAAARMVVAGRVTGGGQPPA
jgi:hypothetical protein